MSQSPSKSPFAPAFPASIPLAVDQVGNVLDGLSVLEYFMAHAPAMPSWFRPTLPQTRPKAPLIDPDTLTDSQNSDLSLYVGGVVAHDDDCDPIIRAHLNATAQWRKDADAWDAWALGRRNILWPQYWATEVLKTAGRIE